MKNDKITLEITAVTPDGYGIGRSENKVVFVPDTAVGDVIEALIIKELKTSSVAKLLEIKKPSESRTEPDCEVCKKCGGCVFRHINYKSELEIKRGFIKDALTRIGGTDIPVRNVVFGEENRYRNKVQYPFGRDENGNCIFGYYAKRSHRIIEHGDCPLQGGIFTKIAAFCAEEADKLKIKAYDEIKRDGILRHAVMRKNRRGEILLCLVVTKKNKELEKLCEAVFDRFGEVIGVHLNYNRDFGNVIFGEKTEKIIGEDTITDELCGKKFELSPRAFYQVNADMAEKLYNKAKELADAKDGSVILDLYCGVGTVGLSVASENDKLCGVEIIAPAVENAIQNAKSNGRSEENTLFVCGDASVGVEECNKKFGKPDIIIVDPPRKGLDENVIKTVVEAAPEKVVYISCDPATLARDIKIFAESGYTPSEAFPFDLFPRTGHVETVVLMSRDKE